MASRGWSVPGDNYSLPKFWQRRCCEGRPRFRHSLLQAVVRLLFPVARRPSAVCGGVVGEPIPEGRERPALPAGCASTRLSTGDGAPGVEDAPTGPRGPRAPHDSWYGLLGFLRRDDEPLSPTRSGGHGRDFESGQDAVRRAVLWESPAGGRATGTAEPSLSRRRATEGLGIKRKDGSGASGGFLERVERVRLPLFSSNDDEADEDEIGQGWLRNGRMHAAPFPARSGLDRRGPLPTTTATSTGPDHQVRQRRSDVVDLLHADWYTKGCVRHGEADGRTRTRR